MAENQSTVCKVAGCASPIKRQELCYAHYMKNWRYGTPTPTFEPRHAKLAGKRYGTLTVIERRGLKWLCHCDCGETRSASTGELNREGDRNTCGVAGKHLAEVVGYTAAHDRVRRDRGSADRHACRDCGRTAKHWSYTHDDPNELVAYGLSRSPIAYSTTPDFYVARCVPCHKKHDLGIKNATF